MESIYTKLALYGRKNECTRTDNVFFPISEVCNGTVSLRHCRLDKPTFDISEGRQFEDGQADFPSNGLLTG